MEIHFINYYYYLKKKFVEDAIKVSYWLNKGMTMDLRGRTTISNGRRHFRVK